MPGHRRTQDFYSKLLDWNIKQAGPAAMIETGGSGGINGHITSLGHEPHNFVTVYVQVDDIVAAIAPAASPGSRIWKAQRSGYLGRKPN